VQREHQPTMGSGHLSRAEFERTVTEALDTLPKRFADVIVPEGGHNRVALELLLGLVHGRI